MSQQVSGRRRRREDEFSPGELFANGEQGAWYDPSDFATLYQDSAGTTPVTALGQPVGLMLDKANWDGRGVVNLLTQTEALDQSPPWIYTDVTVSANATTAPDGTLTADKVIATSVANIHRISQGVPVTAGSAYTLSVYLKAAEYSTAVLQQGPSGAFTSARSVIVNLATGQITGETVSGSGSIESIGGGWYRVSVTSSIATGNGSPGIRIYVNQEGGFVGDDVSGIYVWGAQAERNATATAYQPNGAGVGGPGNHAAQATTAAMPYVQARVNLLELTEGTGSFEFSPWLATTVSTVTHSHADPFGGTDAAKIFERNAFGLFYVQQPQDLIAGIPYTVSVWAKASERDFMRISTSTLGWGDTLGAYFDLANGTVGTVQSGVAATISDAGGGWYRCSMTKTPSTGGSGQSVFVIQTQDDEGAYTGDPTKGIFLYGAQLELGSTATTYQRVTTATDYADIGLPRYLEFDGVDDAMATQSVDFSSTDEMTVCAGVYKTTTAPAIVTELSAETTLNNGSFFFGVGAASSGQDAFVSRGTTSVTVRSGSNIAARLDVWTATAHISQPIASLRANGLEIDSRTDSQGTGNYGDYPLYIGARNNGAAFEFNGRIHQLIIRGATTAGALLDQTEAYVARKTGVPWYSVIQSPASLFEDGEVGAWYDPSDLSSLYEDAAGTTPVTQLGQPVGLMLDKSQGGRPTQELVDLNSLPTPTILDSSGSTGDWDAATRTMSNTVIGTNNSFPRFDFDFGLAAGARYAVSGRLSGDLTSVALIRLSSSGFGNNVSYSSATGVFAAVQLAAYDSLQFLFDGTQLADVTIEELSIREIPGNHASQSTAAARPTVEARVNLAEGTDSLTGWTDQVNGITRSYPAVTTPNGIPAVLAQLDTSPGWALERVTVASSGSHVYSMYVKAGTAAATKILFRNNTTSTILAIATFTFASPSGNYETLDDGWYRIWVTSSSITAGDEVDLYWYPGNDVIGASAYGAGGQLEEGSTVTTYQRVTTATDYADVGAPVYLQFDGVDDQMVLSGNALSMSNNKPAFSIIIGNRSLGTDEMPVFFGSGTGGTRMNINTFTVNIYGSGRRLDADSFASAIRTATPSEDLVISALFRWFDAKLELRANQTSTVLDPFQTAGNSDSTDSTAILIGGPSYANVRLYAIIFRAADIAGTLLNQTERYVANKTGVSL